MGHIGNVFEGKGYIHANHQDMSRFDCGQDSNYRRVAGVIEEFVADAIEAAESKRLPRSVSEK